MEEKVRQYREVSDKIAELEELRKELGADILQAMPAGTKSMEAGGFRVKRLTRLSIKTPMEEAKRLNLVKLEEVLDREKIKILFAQGQVVSGVSESAYIQVTRC